MDEPRLQIPAAEDIPGKGDVRFLRQPSGRALEEVRVALRARVDDCWDRLDDAVCELVALHEVPEPEILARVMLAAAAER